MKLLNKQLQICLTYRLINIFLIINDPLAFFKFFVKVLTFILKKSFGRLPKFFLRGINRGFEYNFSDFFDNLLIK